MIPVCSHDLFCFDCLMIWTGQLYLSVKALNWPTFQSNLAGVPYALKTSVIMSSTITGQDTTIRSISCPLSELLHRNPYFLWPTDHDVKNVDDKYLGKFVREADAKERNERKLIGLTVRWPKGNGFIDTISMPRSVYIHISFLCQYVILVISDVLKFWLAYRLKLLHSLPAVPHTSAVLCISGYDISYYIVSATGVACLDGPWCRGKLIFLDRPSDKSLSRTISFWRRSLFR